MRFRQEKHSWAWEEYRGEIDCWQQSKLKIIARSEDLVAENIVKTYQKLWIYKTLLFFANSVFETFLGLWNVHIPNARQCLESSSCAHRKLYTRTLSINELAAISTSRTQFIAKAQGKRETPRMELSQKHLEHEHTLLPAAFGTIAKMTTNSQLQRVLCFRMQLLVAVVSNYTSLYSHESTTIRIYPSLFARTNIISPAAQLNTMRWAGI